MPRYLSILCLVGAVAGLAACQSTPPNRTTLHPLPPTVEKMPPKRVVITPYPDDGIEHSSQPLPQTPVVETPPPRVLLPKRQPQDVPLKDGRGVAAYQQLMQDYISALGQQDLSTAERLLTQAQRIAPQSADVYREFARLSNLKKQGTSAEAFARKGLTFAQNNTQRKQLWQQILQSAQLRNNAVLAKHAQAQIARY